MADYYLTHEGRLALIEDLRRKGAEADAEIELERLRTERDEAVRLLKAVTMQIRAADLMRSGLDGPIDAFLASLEDKVLEHEVTL